MTSAGDIIDALATADPSRSSMLEPDWEPDFDGTEPIDTPMPTADDRSRLVNALSVTPVPVDELLASTGLSVPAVQMLLLELDLAGQLEWSSGQLVALRG